LLTKKLKIVVIPYGRFLKQWETSVYLQVMLKIDLKDDAFILKMAPAEQMYL